MFDTEKIEFYNILFDVFDFDKEGMIELEFLKGITSNIEYVSWAIYTSWWWTND